MPDVIFVARRTFDANIAGRRSRYLTGRSYTIGQNNVDLALAVEEWRRDGMVDIVPQPPGTRAQPAKLRGTATTMTGS